MVYAEDFLQLRLYFPDQFEHLQDELERRREECIQLRTVLANVSLDEQPFSLLSRSSELPEAEELFTAYETQKSVIAQLQDQLADEKARTKDLAVSYTHLTLPTTPYV